MSGANGTGPELHLVVGEAAAPDELELLVWEAVGLSRVPAIGRSRRCCPPMTGSFDELGEAA